MQLKGNNFRIPINNLMIGYSDEGLYDAPVVILIHGFPFNRTMWEKQVEVLKEKYRVIAYDVRGHGNSDAGKDEFSVGLFARDLIALMDELKIEKAVLCGLSMGGYIALHAIENYTDRINALILCDTTCKADTPEGMEKRMKAIESIRESGVEAYADSSLKNFFAKSSFTKRIAEIIRVRKMMASTSEHTIVETLLALSKRKETCNFLPEIKVPVLILVGKEDIITPPEAAKFMHQRIKSSVLHIVKNAGHISNLENPVVFNEHLSEFIASVYKENE
jgi:3-oxoadipate enol-lactonase